MCFELPSVSGAAVSIWACIIDKQTGQRESICALAMKAERAQFDAVRHDRADPVNGPLLNPAEDGEMAGDHAVFRHRPCLGKAQSRPPNGSDHASLPSSTKDRAFVGIIEQASS